MPLNISDPIYEMLSHARGYAAGDTLVQSISLCIGFWFLDAKTIRKLSAGTVRQQDFEDAVCLCLERRSRQAEAAFRGFSQVRLGEHGFQDLFFHWVKFSGDKNRLLRLIERMIYPFLTRASWPYIAVPAWLERLAVELLPAGEGTFYSGASGVCGPAFEIARQRREWGIPLRVVTCEEHPGLFHLSVLLASMYGFEFEQYNTDCLRDGKAPVKADFSIMFPPLRGGEPVRISDSLTCGSDWAYAYHQLCALNENGAGVCRISNGALFNAKNRRFREYLLKRNVVDAVIALPKSSLPFTPSAPSTSLVVFRRGRKKDDAVQMAELPESSQLRAKGSPLRTLAGAGKSVLPIVWENSREVPPSELDASNLSPQRYLSWPRQSDGPPLPCAGEVAEGGGLSRKAVQMKDVAQIYRGINVAAFSRSGEGVEVLRLSDVQEGRIRMDGVARYGLPDRTKQERYRIHKGDILISCKGKAIKLCVVSEKESPLLSHDFLGIRPDPAKANPWYLFYFLQSPAGQQAIQQIQMGSSITMIRAADLERLPLHYIPLAQQTQYAAELREANILLEEQLAAVNASRQRAYERFYQKIGLEDTL